MDKKFEILSTSDNNSPSENTVSHSEEKKFIITGESPVIFSSKNDVGSGKFKNATQTRPQKCPLCLTTESAKPGNIFRAAAQSWGCKCCKYTWGS